MISFILLNNTLCNVFVFYMYCLQKDYSENEICEIEVINPLIPSVINYQSGLLFMLLSVYFTPSKVIFYHVLSRDQFCLATSTCRAVLTDWGLSLQAITGSKLYSFSFSLSHKQGRSLVLLCSRSIPPTAVYCLQSTMK